MPPRVVIITGASSGIGRATAIRFGRALWRVGLIARSEEGLEEACRDVVTAGGTAAMAVADVSVPEQLSAAATVEAALGPMDVWINNAGVNAWGWFEDRAVCAAGSELPRRRGWARSRLGCVGRPGRQRRAAALTC